MEEFRRIAGIVERELGEEMELLLFGGEYEVESLDSDLDEADDEDFEDAVVERSPENVHTRVQNTKAIHTVTAALQMAKNVLRFAIEQKILSKEEGELPSMMKTEDAFQRMLDLISTAWKRYNSSSSNGNASASSGSVPSVPPQERAAASSSQSHNTTIPAAGDPAVAPPPRPMKRRSSPAAGETFLFLPEAAEPVAPEEHRPSRGPFLEMIKTMNMKKEIDRIIQEEQAASKAVSGAKDAGPGKEHGVEGGVATAGKKDGPPAPAADPDDQEQPGAKRKKHSVDDSGSE